MLICQLTDLHVRPVGKAANRVCETNMLTERAFRAVARLNPRPDVVVITGDLTDCGLDTEYANLTRMLRTLAPMPVFVIPGNHDQRDGTGPAHHDRRGQPRVERFRTRRPALCPGVVSGGHGARHSIARHPIARHPIARHSIARHPSMTAPARARRSHQDSSSS